MRQCASFDQMDARQMLPPANELRFKARFERFAERARVVSMYLGRAREKEQWSPAIDVISGEGALEKVLSPRFGARNATH